MAGVYVVVRPQSCEVDVRGKQNPRGQADVGLASFGIVEGEQFVRVHSNENSSNRRVDLASLVPHLSLVLITAVVVTLVVKKKKKEQKQKR